MNCNHFILKTPSKHTNYVCKDNGACVMHGCIYFFFIQGDKKNAINVVLVGRCAVRDVHVVI